MRAYRIALLVVVCVLGSNSTAFSKADDFLGVWTNVDCGTNGVTRLVISKAGLPNVLRIRTFGKCTPTDCDWGTERLFLYGANVSDTDYQHATATYDQRQIVSLLALEFEDDGRLAFRLYTRFKKGSRQFFHSHDHFRRSRERPNSCPDLVVETIEKPQWDGDNRQSTIRVVITNVGTALAAKTIARLTDPSTPQSTGAPYNDIAEVPALDPGESATVTFTLPYWVFNPDAELEVEADYKGMLKECDENNNTKHYFHIG